MDCTPMPKEVAHAYLTIGKKKVQFDRKLRR